MKVHSLLLFFLLVSRLSNGQQLPQLKISDNQRYLVTQNDDPFFWLGDTAWELIHRLNREEIDLYLADRAEKGFTIIQTVILAELDGINTPNAYGDKPLIDNDPTKLNEAYFSHVDYFLNKAEELGLYVVLLPAWGDKFQLRGGSGPLIFTPANAQTYGELLSQRYADRSHIIWVVGGDRTPTDKTQRNIIISMAKGLQKNGQGKLITFHPAGAKKATDTFNEDWLDFDMFQSGHDRRTKEYEFIRASRKVQPIRPVVNGEPRYENIPERFWEPGEHVWLDDADVRATAYWTMLSGAAGYTYGCNDIWQMYEMSREPIVFARTGWQESLQLPGSRQMQYLKNLLTVFPWQEMANDQGLILNDNPEDQKHIVAAIGKEKDFLIAYTPQGRPIQLDLSRMSSKQVASYWYNPRSGESILIDKYSSSDAPTFTPWARGRGSDFVLILLDSKSSIVVPGLK